MPVITLMLVIPQRIFGVSYLLKLLFLSLSEELILCYNEAFIAGPTYLGILELPAIKHTSNILPTTFYSL
jgi:hypothetical protein